MPNYCWNHVTITGNKKELDKIYRKFNKYKDCNYFTAFGDFILGKGKIDDDLDAIKARYGDDFDTVYVYGTRWWEFEMNMETAEDPYLVISGDSAWSPPIQLIRSVCEHFKVRAHIEYEESGCDFGGETFIDEDGSMDDKCYSYGEWRYICDPDHHIEEDLREYYYEGGIDELDDDIKEGRLSYMDKEHICELIDLVREDAELEKTE